MSSRELKTSKFSIVLRTCENSDVFNTLHEQIWYSPQKSKYPHGEKVAPAAGRQ